MSRTLTVYDMDTQPFTAIAGTLTGVPISTFRNIQGDFLSPAWGAGIVWDDLLHCFLWFQDDGQLYTITRVTDATWNVATLPLVGAGPAPQSCSFFGNCFIWGKMQYVPNLQGVVMHLAGNNPGDGHASINGAIVSTRQTYFVRTVA
jgi:hypothetical protein